MDRPCEPCGQLALAIRRAGREKAGAASRVKKSGSSRGLRGGSWNNNENTARVFFETQRRMCRVLLEKLVGSPGSFPDS